MLSTHPTTNLILLASSLVPHLTMALRSYPLQYILTLFCVLVSLPQRTQAFAPTRTSHLLQRRMSGGTPSVARPSSSEFSAISKVQSGLVRCFKQHHGSLFLSTSPDQNEDMSKDAEKTTASLASIVTPSLKDLSPTERILATEKMDPTTRAVVEAAQKRQQSSDDDSEQKYPIDLPSPVLLSTSMILAIASAGCLFELLGGSRESMVVGFGPTLAIALLGTPLSIFLLYAAITKATAETEADDQAFLSGK